MDLLPPARCGCEREVDMDGEVRQTDPAVVLGRLAALFVVAMDRLATLLQPVASFINRAEDANRATLIAYGIDPQRLVTGVANGNVSAGEATAEEPEALLPAIGQPQVAELNVPVVACPPLYELSASLKAVWDTLSYQPMLAKELAEAIHGDARCEDRIRQNISRLRKHGYPILRVPGHGYVRDDRDITTSHGGHAGP